jgi:hypothetical protein
MALKLENKLFLSWDDIESITDVLAEKILSLEKNHFTFMDVLEVV